MLGREANLLRKYLPPKCESPARSSDEHLRWVQDEYVVFITPTRVQTKILTKILAKDNLDPLIKDNMADSLAMMSLLQKICNSPILLKATADKNKGRENQNANAGAILDALAYLPTRPQVEDVSLSGLACLFLLIGMHPDASIREAYGTLQPFEHHQQGTEHVPSARAHALIDPNRVPTRKSLSYHTGPQPSISLRHTARRGHTHIIGSMGKFVTRIHSHPS